MSTRLDPGEFSRACERAMRACTPVPFRIQETWLNNWKDATERMHYLHMNQVAISDSLRTLIRIRGSLRKPNLNLELIKPDVETLWNEIASKANEAAHAFHNSETGFECCFLAIVDNSYITGSVVVSRFYPRPA